MTKQIIAILVGGIIFFVWQFLSWSLLGVHASEFQYTANQDALIECLNENLSEHGSYMIPMAEPGSTQAEAQAVGEANAGKPWAMIHYRTSYSTGMTMNLIRGFVTDLAIAFLLVWLLGRLTHIDMKSAVIVSLAVGFIGFMAYIYGSAIWFETSIWGHVIDTIVQFGLVGVWLGFYLKNPKE